jgi:hypothetical protein
VTAKPITIWGASLRPFFEWPRRRSAGWLAAWVADLDRNTHWAFAFAFYATIGREAIG